MLERILGAGLQAPSNNHLREWEFVVLQEQSGKENVLQYVEEWTKRQKENGEVLSSGTPAQKMYAYAMPKQHTMLHSCPCLMLPFFKAGPNLLQPTSLSSLNSFASIWCCIENLFLAAAAEGLATSMRIPVGDEADQVAHAVGAPEGYLMPCYIGIGYPAQNAAVLEQVECTLEHKVHWGKW